MRIGICGGVVSALPHGTTLRLTPSVGRRFREPCPLRHERSGDDQRGAGVEFRSDGLSQHPPTQHYSEHRLNTSDMTVTLDGR